MKPTEGAVDLAIGGGVADVVDVVETGPVERAADEKTNIVRSLPFFLVNLSPLLIVLTGVSWKAIALLVTTYWVRMWFITAGYHRYFAHRSYRLARVPQFLMALGGITAAQKGPLWWASYHRDHHRFADTDRDIHSPQKGFWWSHAGWILCDKFTRTRIEGIKDFAAFPELRFLDRFQWIGPWLLAGACFAIDGWSGLVVGFLTSTVLLWHSTFFINSLAHVYGRRRYATEDTSRNSALLAFLTLGEGWHNNHHYYPSSCRNGFFWWEWDPTYYVLKALSFVGIVKDMKYAPEWMLDANRVKDGNFDVGMFRLSWTKANRTLQAASGRVGDFARAKQASLRSTLADDDATAGEAGTALQAEVGHRTALLQRAFQESIDDAELLAVATRRNNRDVATKRA